LRRVSRLVGLADKAKKFPRDLAMVRAAEASELARAMAAEPKLLIADEAMAGPLALGSRRFILALLARLSEPGITIILTSTSCAAVMAVLQRVAVLVSARDRRRPARRTSCRRSRGAEGYLGK